MTISSTTNRAQFNCDGSTTSFPFTFRYLEASDLQVYLASPTGTVTLLTLNVDYQITPAIPGPGGTLSFLGGYLSSPPGSGYTLTILRFVPRTQEVDFRNGDALDEENIEGMGDKLTMMVQDLDERIGRAVTAPPSSSLSGIQLPTPEAGKFIRWNSVPDNLENATIADASVQVINEFWTDILAAAGSTLAEALAAMGLDPSLATLTLPDNTTISDFIKTLLDDADAETARATLAIPDATETVKGIAEIATQAEADAGAFDDKIITPKKLISARCVYRKNAIINGAMEIVQRGTSFTGLASGQFIVDRFGYVKSGTISAVHSGGQEYDAPSGLGLNYCLRLTCTTADTSIGADEYAGIFYNVEGYDFARFAGRQAVLSFWVKSSKPGTYSIGLRNYNNDRVYIMEYSITQADTWEFISKPIHFDYSGGTWNYTNGCGICIQWNLACGSTYKTSTLGSWLSTFYLAGSNQVNACDSTSNVFKLTGVQLELGLTKTPFDFRPYPEELALCQRYFWRLGYESAAGEIPRTMEYGLAGNGACINVFNPVPMRAAPTLTKYGTWTATNCNQPTPTGPTRNGFLIYSAITSTGYSEFYPNSSDDYIDVSAEI